MKFSSTIASALLWVSTARAAPASQPSELQTRDLPPYWLLAGDSTTATQNAAKTGGGWGDGFLNFTLKSGAAGHNYGHNGATTASFRSGGDWSTVISQIGSRKSSYTVYVTIQFGHNDQKNGSGVSESQFLQNLITFAKEVKSAGATPILVTPLTRRSFSGSPKKVSESLATQRNLTIQAATQSSSWYIDLNRASTDYCNAIGEDNSHKYNLISTDNTHLNVWGSVVFGRLVSDLIVDKYSAITPYTQPNATLTDLINSGKPA